MVWGRGEEPSQGEREPSRGKSLAGEKVKADPWDPGRGDRRFFGEAIVKVVSRIHCGFFPFVVERPELCLVGGDGEEEIEVGDRWKWRKEGNTGRRRTHRATLRWVRLLCQARLSHCRLTARLTVKNQGQNQGASAREAGASPWFESILRCCNLLTDRFL